MTNRVRTHPLGSHRRLLLRGSSCMSFDEGMDAESGHRLLKAVPKEWFVRSPPSNEDFKMLYRGRPERTDALLLSLPGDVNKATLSVHVLDPKRCRFTRPSTRIVEEQQQDVVFVSMLRLAPGRGKQRLHFCLRQITDERPSTALVRYQPNLRAPLHMLRAMFSNKPCECVQGGEPLVARRNAAASIALDVCEELAHQFWTDIHDPQSIDRRTDLCCDKGQEQAQGVSIAVLRVDRKAALRNQMLDEEAAYPGT